jgi:hypothetical protein
MIAAIVGAFAFVAIATTGILTRRPIYSLASVP